MSDGEHLSEEQAFALQSMKSVLAPDRYVLIGAAAIGYHVALRRTTADVDFVVAASGETVPPRLEAAHWKPHAHHRQRWQNGDALIDVVPATEEDLRLGEVRLGEDFVLSVVGMDLAFSEAEARPVRRGVDVLVPRLPVLALLKMIAWLDRPARTKDLGDFMCILEDALAPDAECRWEPAHPVGAADLDYADQSAFWVGLELGKIAGLAHLHLAKRFLDKMRDDDSTEFAVLCVSSPFPEDGRETRCRARLDAFERGLEAGGRSTPVAPPREDDLPAPVDLFAWRRSGSREMVLHDAIDRRQVVRFRYAGLERVAEPHVLGTKDGRLQILAWQTGGGSSSGGLPSWRLFFVDEMANIQPTGLTFQGQRPSRGPHRDFDRQIALVR